MKMKVKKFPKQDHAISKDIGGRGLRRRLPFTATAVSLPLRGKAVYLNLSNYRPLKPLEQNLLTLGATIEKFLSRDIDYLITNQDKENCEPGVKLSVDGEGSAGSPAVSTPSPFNMGQTNSPSTALNTSKQKKEQPSRGKALCRMAKVDTAASILENAKKWGVKIVHVDSALKYVGKELNKLQAHQLLPKAQNTNAKAKNYKKEKKLKAPHLKFEAENLQYRPYFLELNAWPYVNIDTSAGTCPFDGLNQKGCANQRGGANRGMVQADRLGAEPALPRVLSSIPEEGGRSTCTPIPHNPARIAVKQTTAKPDSLGFAQIVTAGQLKRIREKRKITNKKKGYCECCKLKYEDLYKHVRGDEHQAYIRNETSNYNTLDELIGKGPSPENFLRSAMQSSRSSSQHTEYSEESWEDKPLLISPCRMVVQKQAFTTARKDQPSPLRSRSRLDMNRANDFQNLEGKREIKHKEEQKEGTPCKAGTLTRQTKGFGLVRQNVKSKTSSPSSRILHKQNLLNSRRRTAPKSRKQPAEAVVEVVRHSPRHSCRNLTSFLPPIVDCPQEDADEDRQDTFKDSPHSAKSRIPNPASGTKCKQNVCDSPKRSGNCQTPSQLTASSRVIEEAGITKDQVHAENLDIHVAVPSPVSTNCEEGDEELPALKSSRNTVSELPYKKLIKPCFVFCEILDISSLPSDVAPDLAQPLITRASTADPIKEIDDCVDLAGLHSSVSAENCAENSNERCAELKAVDTISKGNIVDIAPKSDGGPHACVPEVDICSVLSTPLPVESINADALIAADQLVLIELAPVSSPNTKRRSSLNKSRSSPAKGSAGVHVTTGHDVQIKSNVGDGKGDKPVLGANVGRAVTETVQSSATVTSVPVIRPCKKRKRPRLSRFRKKSRVISSKNVCIKAKAKTIPKWRRRTFMTVRRFKLPQKWKVLSDRSIVEMFASENDIAEFDGFTEADLSLQLGINSELSYVEVSEVDLEEKSDIEWEITMETCDSPHGKPLASTLQTLLDVDSTVVDHAVTLDPKISASASVDKTEQNQRDISVSKVEIRELKKSNNVPFCFSLPVDKCQMQMSASGFPPIQKETGNFEVVEETKSQDFSFSSLIEHSATNSSLVKMSIMPAKHLVKSVPPTPKICSFANVKTVSTKPKHKLDHSTNKSLRETDLIEETCTFIFADPDNLCHSNRPVTPRKSGAEGSTFDSNNPCGVTNADKEIQFNFSSPQRLCNVFSPLKSKDKCQSPRSWENGGDAKITPRRLDMGDNLESAMENLPLSSKFQNLEKVVIKDTESCGSVSRVKPTIHRLNLQEKQKRLVELSREYCPDLVTSQFSSPTKCQKAFSAVIARSASPGKCSSSTCKSSAWKTIKPVHINAEAACSPSRSAKLNSHKRLSGNAETSSRLSNPCRSDSQLASPNRPLHQNFEENTQRRCSPRLKEIVSDEHSNLLKTPVSKRPSDPNRRLSSGKVKPKSQPLDFQHVQQLKKHPTDVEAQLKSHQTDCQPRRKLLKTEHGPSNRRSYYRFDYITTAKGKKETKKLSPCGKSVNSKPATVVLDTNSWKSVDTKRAIAVPDSSESLRSTDSKQNKANTDSEIHVEKSVKSKVIHVHNSDSSSKRSASPVFPGTKNANKKRRSGETQKQKSAHPNCEVEMGQVEGKSKSHSSVNAGETESKSKPHQDLQIATKGDTEYHRRPRCEILHYGKTYLRSLSHNEAESSMPKVQPTSTPSRRTSPRKKLAEYDFDSS